MTDSTIEPYENTLSVEELRRELRYSLDVQYGILHALRDAPEMPSPFVLTHLSSAAKWPEDFTIGKLLQRKYGLTTIPPKTECECGAGLWARILPSLKGDLAEANSHLITLVERQACDEGCWFEAQTCAEAYLQDQLRQLHAAIEGTDKYGRRLSKSGAL